MGSGTPHGTTGRIMSDADLYPRDLVDRLQIGGVTPFIGSGFSIPSGGPGWYDILGGLFDDLADNGIDVDQFRQQLQQGSLTPVAAASLYGLISGKYNLRQYVQSRVNQAWQANAYHRSPF